MIKATSKIANAVAANAGVGATHVEAFEDMAERDAESQILKLKMGN